MMWGSLENLHILGATILARQLTAADGAVLEIAQTTSGDNSDVLTQEERLSLRLTQLCRACLMLTFYAVQDSSSQGQLQSAPGNLERMGLHSTQEHVDGSKQQKSDSSTSAARRDAEEHFGILSEQEILWLKGTKVMSRPQLVISWIWNFFEELRDGGYEINPAQEVLILQNITTARSSANNTIAAIEAQLPYPYVHLIYWTTQIILTVLAVETGVVLATNVYQSENGADGYTPADDSEVKEWPHSKQLWYTNQFFAITFANIFFALFTEGALKVCDKLSNPLSAEDTSFSEKVFGAFLYNNCRAVRGGYVSYRHVQAANAAALCGSSM